MTFAELQASLLVFGLGERATLKEIKIRHRELHFQMKFSGRLTPPGKQKKRGGDDRLPLDNFFRTPETLWIKQA
ncbi:hypothetical protein [Geotalea uraniireducens]|uniref:hypothetical protein n=1 Tax=Geotalea uraniireducens TaxID=351604 RepID=UPI000304292B|nr:hypothetical protein [Geotalea uraniireducens]